MKQGLFPSAVTGSLSLSVKLSLSCSGAPLLALFFESQIFSGRYHEECIVSYCSWGGDVFTLTFLSSTDISTVPSKTYLWDQELVRSLQS